jgi:hypothetical protein
LTGRITEFEQVSAEPVARQYRSAPQEDGASVRKLDEVKEANSDLPDYLEHAIEVLGLGHVCVGAQRVRPLDGGRAGPQVWERTVWRIAMIVPYNT